MLRCLLLAITLSTAALAATPPRGLSVSDEGTLQLHGKPFRGIGINFVEPLLRLLDRPDDPSIEAGFVTMEKYRIPFCRIVGAGWGGPGMKLYQADRDEYFRRLDKVLRTAEKHRVGVILSLFWTLWPGELSGDKNLNAWANPQSTTYKAMSSYVQEVVTRYRTSPALWGWEFGNELNLAMDLPNAKDFNIKPDDAYTHQTMRQVYVAFGKQVRRWDRTRWIDTGGAMPRPSAWHQIAERSWTMDTMPQMEEVLAEDNPDPITVVSVHCYSDEDFARLPKALKVARSLKKPLFVGEFGVDGPRDEASVRRFRAQLDVLDREKVDIAAVWELDPTATDRLKWTIREDNDRVYMLEAIRDLNSKWRAAEYK